MTIKEYEEFLSSLTPFEKRAIHLLEKIAGSLEEIAAVGRD